MNNLQDFLARSSSLGVMSGSSDEEITGDHGGVIVNVGGAAAVVVDVNAGEHVEHDVGAHVGGGYDVGAGASVDALEGQARPRTPRRAH